MEKREERVGLYRREALERRYEDRAGRRAVGGPSRRDSAVALVVLACFVALVAAPFLWRTTVIVEQPGSSDGAIVRATAAAPGRVVRAELVAADGATVVVEPLSRTRYAVPSGAAAAGGVTLRLHVRSCVAELILKARCAP